METNRVDEIVAEVAAAEDDASALSLAARMPAVGLGREELGELAVGHLMDGSEPSFRRGLQRAVAARLSAARRDPAETAYREAGEWAGPPGGRTIHEAIYGPGTARREAPPPDPDREEALRRLASRAEECGAGWGPDSFGGSDEGSHYMAQSRVSRRGGRLRFEDEEE